MKWLLRAVRLLAGQALRRRNQHLEHERDRAVHHAGRLLRASQALSQDNLALRRRLVLLEPTVVLPPVAEVDLSEMPTVAISVGDQRKRVPTGRGHRG